MRNLALILIVVVTIHVTATICLAQQVNGHCKDVKPSLLILTKRVGGESQAISKLFQIGDECINDLISILNGSDFQMSVSAQEVIRYLGNENGLKALEAWNERNAKPYPVRGPIPLPVMRFDYEMIEANFLENDRKDLGLLTSNYLYALAMDRNSDKSKDLLQKILKRLEFVDKASITKRLVDRLIVSYPLKPFSELNGVENTVLNNAFFLSDEDKKFTNSELLSFNGSKDKALISLHVSRGVLAEEWYHVVVRKAPSGWEFYSITFVKQS